MSACSEPVAKRPAMASACQNKTARVSQASDPPLSLSRGCNSCRETREGHEFYTESDSRCILCRKLWMSVQRQAEKQSLTKDLLK